MMTKKIKENPSTHKLFSMIQSVQKVVKIADKIPLLYKFFPKANDFRNKFKEIEGQMDIFDLPDEFNTLISEYGWIAYESMNLEVMRKSIFLAKNGQSDEIETFLADSYDEKLVNWLILKCESRKVFRERVRLFTLAKEDYINERYHACIPLLLGLIDGLVNDITKHVGFFTEKSDVELFDSIVGHRTGLPFLKKIMNSSRKTTNLEPIYIPYRNGILHGRELVFDNKINAAKCWMTLACVIDWADGFTNPKNSEEKISLIESLKSLNETTKLTGRINSWSKRKFAADIDWTTLTKAEIALDTPEYALLSFMDSWQKAQWGKLSPLLLHFFNTSNKPKIKEIKDDYSPITLKYFSILSIEDISPAITDISIKVHIVKNHFSTEHELRIRLIYADENGRPLLRGESNGKWGIIQNGFSRVLFSSP